MNRNYFYDVKAMVEFRNANKEQGTPSWDRMDFGRSIFNKKNKNYKADTTISSTLSHWQKGKSEPGITTAGFICKSLGITLDFFKSTFCKLKPKKNA